MPELSHEVASQRQGYWRKNLQYLAILMIIWFAVSYGRAILFVDYLDQWEMAGFNLGFWYAQQGAMYVFVVPIFVYVWLMNRLDRKFDVHEDDEPAIIVLATFALYIVYRLVVPRRFDRRVLRGC